MPPRTWHFVQYAGPSIAFGVAFYSDRLEWARGFVGMLWYHGFDTCLGLPESDQYHRYVEFHRRVEQRSTAAAAALEAALYYLLAPFVLLTPVALFPFMGGSSDNTPANPNQWSLSLPLVDRPDGAKHANAPPLLSAALFLCALAQLLMPLLIGRLLARRIPRSWAWWRRTWSSGRTSLKAD